MKRKDSFKGIPREHQGAVRRYMATVAKVKDSNLFHQYASNPQAAYKSLKAAWKHNAERKAKEDKAQAERAEDARKANLKTIAKQIEYLSIVTDRLHDIEKDKVDDHVNETALVRALVNEIGANLERTLFDLGIYAGNDYGLGRVEGFFADPLKVYKVSK